MARPKYPTHVRRTGAVFEGTERFYSSCNVLDTRAEKCECCGVPLTRVSDNTYATSADEFHTFVIGESGCGKTRRVIMPAIRLIAKSGESMVISDPKGELYRTTAASLKREGYNVRVLNFREPRRGDRWNPLAVIEQLYRTGDEEDCDKAMSMLGDFVEGLSVNISSEKDPYWQNTAKSLFLGVAQLLLEYGEPGSLTLENISTVAMDISRCKERGAIDISVKMGWSSLFNELPAESLIKRNVGVITDLADDTRRSVVGVFTTMLSLYVGRRDLLDMMSRSDISLREIGATPTALFIILPDDAETLWPLATLLVQQTYQSLISLADEQPDGMLPNHVVFILDEFANFAPIPSVASMLTAARSRKIRFVLVCQSVEQLMLKYEPRGSAMLEILLSNCRVWLYMSCRNLQFLERLEKLCGNHVSPYTGDSVPLVSISDMQHFEMGQVLVLNDRCSPVIGWLGDYDSYDFGPLDDPTPTPTPSAKATERTTVTLASLLESAGDKRPHAHNVPIPVAPSQDDVPSGMGSPIRAALQETIDRLQRLQNEDETVADEASNSIGATATTAGSKDDEESAGGEPSGGGAFLASLEDLLNDEDEDAPSSSAAEMSSTSELKTSLQRLIEGKLADHADE